VGPLLVATKPAEVTEQRPVRWWRRLRWLIPLCYLLPAFAITWRLWANLGQIVPTDGAGPGVSPDVYLNSWFMRYAATAVAGGHLPALVTHAVNAPQGINVMWNTSLLLPSVLLAPLTLAAGPIVSLAVLSTLAFAGSAASLYFVLRRWGAGIGAAVVGGAVYGFSPALAVAGEDHYHLQFAVLPPLIIDAGLRLAAGRGRPAWNGLLLGLLVSAQLFIAEEMLVDTALAGLVLLLVLVVFRPLTVHRRVLGALAGLGVALPVVGLLCGHALWVQMHGPLTENRSPWHIGRYGNHLGSFVSAPFAVFLHGQFEQFLASTNEWRVEAYGYLGWPLLVLLAVIAVVFWRDLRIRVTAFSFVGVELLSLGGHVTSVGSWRIPADWLPWHLLWQLPILNQVVVNRISILADGLAAAALAFGIERTVAEVRLFVRRQRLALGAAAIALVAVALVPIIPRPLPAWPVTPPPPGWQAVLTGLKLPPGANVLVLPFDGAVAMEWQAVTGERISVIGGYCVAPSPNGHGALCDTQTLLSPAQFTTALRVDALPLNRRDTGPAADTTAQAVQGWQAAAIVTPTGPHSRIARYLISVFGRPTIERHDVLGWRLTSGWYQQLEAQTSRQGQRHRHHDHAT
jgi:hypothetical protein